MNEERRSLEELLPVWRSGAERLYPVILVEPELYQDHVTLVRAIADRLADTGEPAALALSYQRDEPWFREIREEFLARIDLPRRSLLDFRLAKDAAYYLRYGEIVEARQREESRRRIALARGAREEWVTLRREEVSRGSWALFSCVEMHAESGVGLHYYGDLDPERGMIYGLDVVQLDPETGEPLRRSTFREGSGIFTRLDGLMERVDSIRSLYSRRTGDR